MLIEWRYTYFSSGGQICLGYFIHIFIDPCVEVLSRIVNDCEGDSSMLPGVVDQGTEKSISLHTKIVLLFC